MLLFIAAFALGWAVRAKLGANVERGVIKLMKNQKVDVQSAYTIAAEDEFGNPTGAFDASPAWSLTDSTLGTVTVSPDGLAGTVVPSGKLGTCKLQVAAVSGGKSYLGEEDFTFIPGDVAKIALVPGADSANTVPPTSQAAQPSAPAGSA